MTTDYPTEGDEKGSQIFLSFHPFFSLRAIIFAPKLIPFVQAVGLACFFFGMYKTAQSDVLDTRSRQGRCIITPFIFILDTSMLCTVLYPRVHNEYSKHCTKKKPYRAKRLGIYCTLGM